MRVVAKVGVVAAFLLVPGAAEAVCGQAAPIHVWPHRGVAVPTNAQIALSAPATWRRDATLMLVTAPSDGPDSWKIKLSPRGWTSGGVERLELRPMLALLPSTSYEVRTSRGEIVGAFTTSVMADTRPPTWGGVSSGRIARPSKRAAPLECGSALVILEAPAAATDDQTTSADIRYALWAGTLDYTSPPLTWTTASSTSGLVLGFGNSDEAESDFELPKTRPLHIGIKAIDLAGNATAASELILR